MKIIWVVNIPFGKLSDLAGIDSPFASGTWLNAALKPFINDGEHEIIVIAPWYVKEIKILIDFNITYCLIPGGPAASYNPFANDNIKIWKQIKALYKPDIINIWGTEYSHSYLALRVFSCTPSVIYIQGLIASVHKYYIADLSFLELTKAISIRDILRIDWIFAQRRKLLKRAQIESKMLNISKNFIIENQWAKAHCNSLAPDGHAYKSLLPIDDVFFSSNWDFDRMEPFTIMCNATGYPLKGLHVLLKAFSIVVQRFPSAKLFIPGEKSPFELDFISRLRETGYTKFIKYLIKKLGIFDNVEFCGRLTSSEMAHKLSHVNAFVMPSCIENHSSSLIEAMLVGVPCIASCVGGVQEYAVDRFNCTLYRFEEYELLAEHITSYFLDPEMIKVIGENAKKSMRSQRSKNNIKNDLVKIYRSIKYGD